MSFLEPKTVNEGVVKQLSGFGTGAALAAINRQPISITQRATNPYSPLTAMQVGSAMSVAAINGTGVSGTLAAGFGVITGKVVLATAAVTAAAPAVLAIGVVGAIGYGLYRLCK